MESDGASEGVANLPPNVNWPECTHALVHFQEEDKSSIVPVSRIDKVEELSVGNSCFVTWSDKKKYLGRLLFAGSLDTCAAEQEKLESSDEESDNVSSSDKKSNTENSLEKEKDEAKNDENDSGLSKAAKRRYKRKKDKDATEEGPSKKKPKKVSNRSKQTESQQKKKQMTKKNPKSVQTNKGKGKKEFDLVVGVAPPRLQVPNSAGQSVDIEDNSDDNYSYDDLYSSSDDNESNEKVHHIVVSNGVGDHSSSPVHYTGGLKKKSLRTVLIEVGQLKSSVKRIADEQNEKLTDIKQKLQDVHGQVQILTATNIASKLTPFLQSNATAAIQSPSGLNAMMPPANVIPTTSPMMSPANISSNHGTPPTARMMSRGNISSNHVTPPTAPMMSPGNISSNHVTPPTAPMMSRGNIPSNHVTPPTAPMMSRGNISSNHVTPPTTPMMSQGNISSNHVAPTMSTQSGNNSRLNEDFAEMFPANLSLSEILNDNNVVNEILVDTDEVSGSQPLSYNRELLSSSEITPIYVKSKSRNNFAALLVERLFDVQTRLKSNVAGRGKERLDPEIMQYIKAKVFEFYECNASEVKDQWKKCITSIDDKSRGLRRKTHV